MNHPGANAYLRTQILTASPHELRLMLFDGALKFVRAGRAELGKEKPDYEALFEAFSRAKKIVMELGNGLDRGQDPELCDRMSAVFDFVYRRLVESNLERDAAKADEAIQLLTYERETWALAVQRAGAEATPPSAPQPVVAANPYATPAPPAGHRPLSQSA